MWESLAACTVDVVTSWGWLSVPSGVSLTQAPRSDNGDQHRDGDGAAGFDRAEGGATDCQCHEAQYEKPGVHPMRRATMSSSLPVSLTAPDGCEVRLLHGNLQYFIWCDMGNVTTGGVGSRRYARQPMVTQSVSGVDRRDGTPHRRVRWLSGRRWWAAVVPAAPRARVRRGSWCGCQC